VSAQRVIKLYETSQYCDAYAIARGELSSCAGLSVRLSQADVISKRTDQADCWHRYFAVLVGNSSTSHNCGTFLCRPYSKLCGL